jgi:hypothetical protein
MAFLKSEETLEKSRPTACAAVSGGNVMRTSGAGSEPHGARKTDPDPIKIWRRISLISAIIGIQQKKSIHQLKIFNLMMALNMLIPRCILVVSAMRKLKFFIICNIQKMPARAGQRCVFFRAPSPAA